MSFLLDTNFVIGLLRGARSYWECLERLSEETFPSISTITRADIYAGCHPSEEAGTRTLLGCFKTIPVNADIADTAGRYAYQFARRGITLHLEDALIGATAVCEELVLVTQNVSHFPMLSLNSNLLQFPTQ